MTYTLSAGERVAQLVAALDRATALGLLTTGEARKSLLRYMSDVLDVDIYPIYPSSTRAISD
jgi:hypothetical protein